MKSYPILRVLAALCFALAVFFVIAGIVWRYDAALIPAGLLFWVLDSIAAIMA